MVCGAITDGIIRRVDPNAHDLLKTAHALLDVAHLGHAVLREVAARQVPALRNVTLFGARVEQQLLALGALAPGASWFKPARRSLDASRVVRLFRELALEFARRDAQGVSAQARLKTFNYPADLAKLGRRPAQATELFMGDEIGGTGWQLEFAPGMTAKYYVILPAEYGSVDLFLAATPVVQTSRDPRPIDVDAVCDQYVTTLDAALRSAELDYR